MLRGLGLTVVIEPAFAYAAGFGIVLALLWRVGILVQKKTAGLAQRVRDATLAKVPPLGGLYRVLTRLVGLLDSKAEDELRGMTQVWCRFGPEGSPKTLALLTTPEPVVLEGRRHFVVISADVGAGLVMVSVLGLYPMARLLVRMPCNRGAAR